MRTPPSFDTWTVIFLFAAIQGLVLAFLLYLKGPREKRSQKTYLLILMFLFCMMIMEYVLWWTGYLIHYPHVMNVTAPFPYFFGPLLFFYFRKIFRSKGMQWSMDWPHFIPALCFIASHIPLYLQSELTKINYISGTVPRPVGLPWPWLNIIQLMTYTVVCYYEYRSDAENTVEVKRWFRLLLYLFSAFIVAVLSYYSLVRMPWFDAGWDYMISASMMCFIYGLSLYGYFHEKVFNGFDLTEQQVTKPKYQNSSLKTDQGQIILDQLNHIMKEEKLYVDDEINLDKLATRLKVSRHQLSQALNERAQLNFFEYIHSLRIEEAKQLLKNTSKKEFNIIEVAYKVGYANKVTFNNTFKKHTGMTPSEYRSAPSEGVANILPLHGQKKIS